jgi:hypothetical protein
VAVSHDQGVAGIVPDVLVPLHVRVHLGLEHDRQHPLGSAAADLIEGEGELLASIVLCDYPEHRRTSSRRHHRADSSDHESTGGYARPSPGLASTTFVHTSWAHRFEGHRTGADGRYRMLGSLFEVDDAAREAWFRLSRQDASQVENLGGWLTTVMGAVVGRHGVEPDGPTGSHLQPG